MHQFENGQIILKSQAEDSFAELNGVLKCLHLGFDGRVREIDATERNNISITQELICSRHFCKPNRKYADQFEIRKRMPLVPMKYSLNLICPHPGFDAKSLRN